MFFWISSPITQYAVLAATLLCCLCLFISLKKDIAVLQDELGRLRDTPPAAAPAPPPEAPPTEAKLPGPDLNLTTRAQALRMQHRGESVPTIAAALRVPRNEIELLLKVQHRLGADSGRLR